MPPDPRLYFLVRRLEEMKKTYFPDTRIRILDIGCADGSFIGVVRTELSGVERIDGCDVPSRWSQGHQTGRGDIFYLQDIQKGLGTLPLNQYHFITFWEVIEHLENPYTFLCNVSQLLTPGGIVFLTSPNLLGLSRFIKCKKWVGITELDHKYLFDRLSIKFLLERVGYSGIRAKSYLFPSIGPRFDGFNQWFSSTSLGGMLYVTAFKDMGFDLQVSRHKK